MVLSERKSYLQNNENLIYIRFLTRSLEKGAITFKDGCENDLKMVAFETRQEVH